MAKLTLFLLLALTASLLLAEAHRTTVVVNEEEEAGNPRGRGGSQMECRQQFQQQQNLRHCQRYIMQEMQEGGRGCRGGRCVDGSINPYGNGRQDLDMCCEQMEEMDRECRCEGLRMAVQQQQQMGQMRPEEMREAFEVARNIPSMCNLSPGQCQFGFRVSF